MKHRPALAVLAALTLLLCAISCSAGTVYVKWDSPGPTFDGTSWGTAFHTVQAGLNAAVSGDEVWVARGTYVERITLKSGAALYGGYSGSGTTRNIGVHVTILDGSRAGSVVTSPAGAASTTRIDGFTIKNGSGTLVATNKYGGCGIYCSGSSPTIANNTITGNYPTSYQALGAGIYCAASSSPTITGNTITKNITDNYSDSFSGLGGAIYSISSSPTIAGNTITGNEAWDGGGIYCNGSSPTITNNTIAGNIGVYGGGVQLVVNSSGVISSNTITGNQSRGGSSMGGGGILCDASSPAITNNRISGNYGGSGGGIWCQASSSPIIANNTITGNSALYGSGGGICCSTSSPTITNNTIVGNGAVYDGGGICCQSSSPAVSNNIIALNSSGIYGTGSTPTLRNNCVYGNESYGYSGISAGTGDISLDPLLADVPYGNVHIQPGSPCINAGYTGAPELGATDIDGQPRVQDGTPDIGSDESNGATWTAGPYAVIRVSPTGSNANNGSSWTLAKKTVQAGMDAASALGGEVWVKAGTYNERINLRAHAYVYGGFAGTESARSQRNWTVNTTTLDGQMGDSVVTVMAGHRVSALDGFTVRNGNGYYGGGINILGSSPTIANNTITQNGNGYNDGGGIHTEGGSPVIDHSKINYNTSALGGGIYCIGGAPIITNNEIKGNVAQVDGDFGEGGGILCGSSLALISGNVISDNSSNTGGGIYGSGVSPTITNNLILRNRASVGIDYHEATGAGIYLGSPSNAVIVNNTVVDNRSDGYNGGIMVSGSPVIANNIVAFNSPDGISAPGTPTMRNNNVWENGGSYTPRTGDVLADPLFVNRGTDDYHLDPWSPCINVGWDAVPGLPSTDIDGQARVQDGTVDMGADEAEGVHGPPGPYTIVRVSTSGNDANNGSTWPLAKRTVQAAIDAASTTGGEVWVKAGTYVERITLRPYVNIYGGFAGTESARSQRDWTANQTILDGAAGGSVVTATVGHRVSGIDGFTIRNGTGTLVNTYMYGGGIYCVNSSPVISNNRITGNGVSPSIGGGIYCKSCWPLITNNTIVANGPTSSGGGIYSSYSSPTIANNIISGNVSTNNAGGILCEYAYPIITNNTITDNSAAYGGGLYCNFTAATVANNILAFNTSGVYVHGTAPTLRNNCVYGNTGYNYSGITAGTGDISANPLFVDSDYHLMTTSPCKNAGWNEAPGLPSIDMDGEARINDGIVDIGADEYGTITATLPVAKSKADGAEVALRGLTVCAAFNGFFYIQTDDRSCGIRVNKTSHGVLAGNRVDVTGTLATNTFGEKYIAATTVTPNGAGPVEPILLTNRSVGGSDWLYNPATGAGQKGEAGVPDLNNMGLLVMTTGKVTYVSSGFFYLDDGSRLHDGSGYTGIRVSREAQTAPTLNSYVKVTGASSCYKIGSNVYRLVRASSITRMSP